MKRMKAIVLALTLCLAHLLMASPGGVGQAPVGGAPSEKGGRIVVDCAFPGGNVVVHRIEGDELRVSPDLRDTGGSWFYWAFRVRGAAGRRLRVRFVSGNPVGMKGPAISTDGRRTWRWTTERFTTSDCDVTVPAGCDELYLAFAPLYTQENWDRFIASLPSLGPSDRYSVGGLARSRKGRVVELLHLGKAPAGAKKTVIVTARHHCCEMIANYVMEGIASAILAGETEEARWLRENASIDLVPFVDKDGVEEGDQGKNRRPHDHNRDYTDFLYPECKALSEHVARLHKSKGVDAVLDLHCPWIRGAGNDVVYMPGEANAEVEKRQIAFGKILEKSLPEGSLPFRQKDFYPFGRGWNVAGSYTQGLPFTDWVWRQGVPFATTIEIAYASAAGVPVTPGNARLLGQGIATALGRFLQR